MQEAGCPEKQYVRIWTMHSVYKQRSVTQTKFLSGAIVLGNNDESRTLYLQDKGISHDPAGPVYPHQARSVSFLSLSTTTTYSFSSPAMFAGLIAIAITFAASVGELNYVQS
jgi:hypothetical protein